MSQLSFPAFTKMLITNVNIRSEVHGADRIPAMDISVRQTLSNEVLSELDGALRSMFYMAADEKPQQAPLEGIAPISDMPKLRSTNIGPVTVKREFVGYTFTARFGATDTDNPTVGDCKVNNFKAALKEGGSIDLSYRIQCSGVDKDQIGGFGVLVQHEIECTLIAPGEAAQQELPAGNVTPIKPVTATEAFVAAQTGNTAA
jgi:hypothetical protein